MTNDEIIANLRAVFPEVPIPRTPLEPGDSHRARCLRFLSQKRWTEVSQEFYLAEHEFLREVPPEVAAYYWPGYLAACLNQPERARRDLLPRNGGLLKFLTQLPKRLPPEPAHRRFLALDVGLVITVALAYKLQVSRPDQTTQVNLVSLSLCIMVPWMAFLLIYPKRWVPKDRLDAKIQATKMSMAFAFGPSLGLFLYPNPDLTTVAIAVFVLSVFQVILGFPMLLVFYFLTRPPKPTKAAPRPTLPPSGLL